MVSRFLINNSSINTKECAMKNLFLTMAFFLVLLLIGCQENSITDPVSDDSLKKDVTSDTYHQGAILLERVLQDPNNVMNSYFLIQGEIEYEHELVYLDPIPPAPQFYVSLNLSIEAELSDINAPNGPVWMISGEATDLIYEFDGGTYTLTKTFSIQGREDGMYLVCRFIVSANGIELDTISLGLADIDPVNNTSQ
ncbi:MAG: hypothetical protein HKP17_02165 [Ignavibacteriaceae bacterium]|nr:hypothetical protein [Ignavibacteriaceae bacterium]